MKRLLIVLTISTAALLFAITASAEVLLIDRAHQASQKSMPKHGQSMQQVENQFGTPTVRYAPVGQPPISRWEYTDYVVYFENELVLNTVMKRLKGTDKP